MVAGILGFIYTAFSRQLQSWLFVSLAWTPWSFVAWQFGQNALNPWRWISIFAVYFLMRSPIRLAEVEEFWVTRLRAREILKGKLSVAYWFFFLLFHASFAVTIAVSYGHARLMPVALGPMVRSNLQEYVWGYYLNPAFHLYMLLAPAYAAVILTTILLVFRQQAQAFAAALVSYLVVLPFAQDWLVLKAVDRFGLNWSWQQGIKSAWLQWVPQAAQDAMLGNALEYSVRACALILVMIPFGVYLFERYDKVMMNYFEARHF
ncbi:MAG: hypothetical protein Kow0059_04050 [Candidatus Sumerlaeia bacterium]